MWLWAYNACSVLYKFISSTLHCLFTFFASLFKESRSLTSSSVSNLNLLFSWFRGIPINFSWLLLLKSIIPLREKYEMHLFFQLFSSTSSATSNTWEPNVPCRFANMILSLEQTLVFLFGCIRETDRNLLYLYPSNWSSNSNLSELVCSTWFSISSSAAIFFCCMEPKFRFYFLFQNIAERAYLEVINFEEAVANDSEEDTLYTRLDRDDHSA